MDRAWLHEQLAAGRSIESLAREAGRDPSTVAYWVAKHGLASTHAPKHAARGGIARDELEPGDGRALGARDGERLGVSYATVQHWLGKHGLADTPRCAARHGRRPRTVERDCPLHGVTTFVRRRGRLYRCLLCRPMRSSSGGARSSGSSSRRAGGACRLCGYDRVPSRALQFHHLDRAQKAFATVAGRACASRSTRPRAEAPSVCCSARTATRRLKRGVAASDKSYYGRPRSEGAFTVRGSSMAEHSTVNRRVVGSSPTPGASRTPAQSGRSPFRAPDRGNRRTRAARR